MGLSLGESAVVLCFERSVVLHLKCHCTCLLYDGNRAFLGYLPTVLITDLDILKEVFVKQFNSVPNRQVRDLMYLVHQLCVRCECTEHTVCET